MIDPLVIKESGGELGVTNDVGYPHLDKGDAHDRGVPVVAGRWQIYDAPENQREWTRGASESPQTATEALQEGKRNNGLQYKVFPR